MSIMRFPSGLLVGAGLMYFLDPVRGRKRRARIGELALHARRVERDLVGKAVRDASHRAHGLGERVKHPMSDVVADGVLQGRVRAALGRVISHPRAIEVEARGGAVVLRGPIFTREADAAIGCVHRVAGVHEVIDRLERHASADVPSLQGEGRPARPPRQAWRPAMRMGAIATGAGLAAWGIMRRGLFGGVLGAAGGLLALRGTLNQPLGRAFGRGGISVQKTITVNAPIDRVFDLMSRFENFPKFMEHVREVEVIGPRSRWRVDGPAGSELVYESDITRLEPDRVIEWRTLPGQKIDHTGRVRFDETDLGTRVHVELVYRPPAGVLGHAIAHLLGWDPKARMNDDLVRMKALLETGTTRAHGERIRLRDLH